MEGIPMLGIRPFLCEYCLLFWEVQLWTSICQRIRELDPVATALLPSVVSTSRYLDDILFIFPLLPPGPDSLKISNSGPYPDTLSIKME